VADNLTSQIKSRIKGRFAVVGIGNPLGAILPDLLFDCGTAPENYIIPILRSEPETVILVDTVDFGGEPGAIGVFGLDDISSASLSTHTVSPRMIADLLKTGKEGLNVFMVAIQPKSIGFGEGLSREVIDGIDRLKGVFTAEIRGGR
jgi:hydrogenase 3 maturation protease